MYIRKPISFEWDEGKNAYNKSKHGFGFELAHEFDWGITQASRTVRARSMAKPDTLR